MTISLRKTFPVFKAESPDRPVHDVPVYADTLVTLYEGDCIDRIRSLPDCSVDAVITDPPYAIGAVKDVRESFRGDTGLPCLRCHATQTCTGFTLCDACLTEAEEVALRDSPMLGMQSQNWHEKATHSRGYADNDNVQFQRWCQLWAKECCRVLKPGGHLVAFGGTRTWHRLTVAIEDAGFEVRDSLAWLFATGFPKSLDVSASMRRAQERDQLVGPLSAVAGGVGDPNAWVGWGTALKPSHEPIVLARKPLVGTVALNVATHGTGGLNIDATRRGGRWPGNVFLDAPQAQVLNDMTGTDAARFFFVAKPGAGERVRVAGVTHPTVKPLALMRQLVRLVTPPGGVVLEPFAGSGSTVEACVLEGVRVIAVEKDPAYLPLVIQRVERRLDPVGAINATGEDPGLFSLLV